MPEMTDPILDKLAQFTPDAASIDHAEILFRAGRASARTPRIWKIALIGLLLSNAATASLLVVRDRQPSSVPAADQPGFRSPIDPQPDPATPKPPISSESPWSIGMLNRTLDPDSAPNEEPIAGLTAPHRPLTLLAAHRGEID